METTNAEVMLKLQDVFDDIFLEKVELRPDLSAQDVAEWNSLVHVALVAAVEERFGIRFRVGEVEGTRNVGEFASLILKRCNARP
jgi:acyl carrier protein